MKKNYPLTLLNAKRRLFSLALTVLLGTVFAQTTYTFSYSGSLQTATLQPGSYMIECWGADGGTNSSNSGTTPGKGGYSKGTMTLTSITVYTIYVGGKGNGGSQPLGGFNSGNGTTKTNTATATGGGGASDVRVLADNLYNRIIVAGGGGGQGNTTGTGGNGGGLVGQNGQGTGVNIGVGGSQTLAGVYPGGGDAKPATFGEGSDGPAGTTGGQGGGGWYGGSFGTRTNGGGAGGSGYVLTATSYTPTGYFSAHPAYYFTNDVTLRADEVGFVANPDVSGNGLVLIKELCNISITATGLSAGNSLCSGNSVTLTTSAVSNYSWSTGAVTPSIVVAPTSSGVYSVTGTSTAACNAAASISITVNSAVPSLSIVNTASSSAGICLGKSATLTASGALSYTWTGTSSPTPTNGVEFFPTNTSTYIVTATNACGTSTAATTITIAPLLVAAATTSSLLCAGKIATLSAFSAVNGYTWQPNNHPGSTYIVAPLVNTIYTVTASDGTCVGTATVGVNTNPNPTINVATTSTNICLGASISLTATGGSGTNYTWTSTPATTTITGQNVVSPSFPAAGAYAYYATGDNQFGCTNTNMQVIIVNAAPVLTATATKTMVCSSGATTLNITGGDVYQWDANANNATTPATVVHPTQTTTYAVTSTLNATGCPATTSVVVYIYTPTLAISIPTSVCLGTAITLTGSINNPSGGSATYTWTGPGVNSNGTSVSVIPNGLTVYTLTAKSITLGSLICTQTKTTSVGIAPNPTITVTPSRTFVCRGEPVDLIAGGAVSYTWNNNTAVGGTITVTHTNIATIPYSVIGTDAGGCKNDTIYYLKINGCQGIEELDGSSALSVYPNPNNGDFYVIADKDLKLQLINELGQVIRNFELNAANQYKLQLGDIAKGIYFIVDQEKAITPKKIIVK